jgi:hypothetical protein
MVQLQIDQCGNHGLDADSGAIASGSIGDWVPRFGQNVNIIRDFPSRTAALPPQCQSGSGTVFAAIHL